MTLTHPDTIPTTAPPSPGDLALTLTAVHAAATIGDLDGYTGALQVLRIQIAACLRAAGAAFECETCDIPIDLDQLPAATPLPARVPAQPRTATAQAYVLRVAAYLVTLLPDVELSVSTWQHTDDLRVSVHSSEKDKQRAAELKLAGLQRLRSVLGGGWVHASPQNEGTLYLNLRGQFGDVPIDAWVVLNPVGTVQDDARAWAATTQLTPATP